MSALGRDGFFHEGNHEGEGGCDKSGEKECVEVGEGRLLGGCGIAGLLEESPSGLIEEGGGGRVEEVEAFVEAQGVKLLAALGDGLSQRGAKAAAFVAKQGKNADCGAAQMAGNVEKGGDVDWGKDQAEANDEDNAGSYDLGGRDIEIQLGHPIAAGGERTRPAWKAS